MNKIRQLSLIAAKSARKFSLGIAVSKANCEDAERAEINGSTELVTFQGR